MRPRGHALRAEPPSRPCRSPVLAPPPGASGGATAVARADTSTVPLTLGAALGASLCARRSRRSTLLPRKAQDKDYNGVLGDLSQEELLAFELAEADLSLDEDEEEEEEWRHYDEEVAQMKDLLETTGASIHTATASDLQAAAATANGTLAGSKGSESGLDEGSLESIRALSLLLEMDGLQNGRRPKLTEQSAEDSAEESLALAPAAWEPGISVGSGRGVSLPSEYRQRLVEQEGGVVVTGRLGPNSVVLLSRVPDQPELLPVLSETFRMQRVRILRGWLETTDGVAMDAFEVCEDATGEPLSEAREEGLEAALVQAVRAPAARQVLFDIDGQVPRLDAFFGLPVGAPRCPPLPAARGALVGGPFSVLEARDLGRALVFRVELDESVPPEEALDECRRRLWKISPQYEGQWECLLVNGISGQLLTVLPCDELEQALQPSFNSWLVCLLCAGVTAVYSQGAAAAAVGGVSPVAKLLCVVLGAAEIARRAVGQASGVRLSPPFFLPSPAIGTFGAASRAVSVVPNARVLFDMAAAALTMALLASSALIASSFLLPVEPESCAWVNPGLFPVALNRLVHLQAESLEGACAQPPSGTGLLAVPATLVAGCFGALATALNSLPLGSLGSDGTVLTMAVPWPGVRDAVLPWAACILVGCSFIGVDSDDLFPVILAFIFFSIGVRPLLVAEPVFREGVSQPQDLLRQLACLLLTSVAFFLMTPSSVLDLFSMVASTFSTSR